jgi:hypothetical protein
MVEQQQLYRFQMMNARKKLWSFTEGFIKLLTMILMLSSFKIVPILQDF